jgi:transglutaminase-like putative cysteine protease
MYDLRQFRPALYLLLIMGMTGFALAAESPGLWILGIGAIVLHAWLSKTNRFKPLPRLLANVITLAALFLAFVAVRAAASTPILTIGQFLVFLQLVKLYELRANRDYAQLLILSLLLMVAAIISTASLAFAALLAAYLFVSLYCCLMFHLKVENDRALAAQVLPAHQPHDATVRQDQRFLPRSMRRLAALVTLIGVSSAVIVFLFFPRGTGAGMLGQLQFPKSDTLTGFSENVSFDEVHKITQNNEIAAHVQLWKNEQPVEGTMTLYLRGRTLDTYKKDTWQWGRPTANPRFHEETGSAGSPVSPRRGYRETIQPGPGLDVYRQRISLRPTGTKTLFALRGAALFTPHRDMGKVRFYWDDLTIATIDPLYQRLDYEVLSRDPPAPGIRGWDELLRRPIQSYISPSVAAYARKPEVSGTDDQGRPLASLRNPAVPVHELDEQIARNVEKHLRSTFGYTLDLTAEYRDPDKDPVEQFLFEWKKGHCEYFASSMVLMCQSMGLRARLVTGFRVGGNPEDYDASLGHYYIVRQSHAHAWVEVYTGRGWQTFDPTSGTAVDMSPRRTTWQSVRHFLAFLEYKWQSSVVAYDADRRENLINYLDQKAVNSMLRADINPNRLSRRMTRWWRDATTAVDDWLTRGQGWALSAKLVVGMIVLLVGICLAAIARFVTERWRMRRRAARIGLSDLPPGEQIRLAKQLGFYERLTRMLHRRAIVRPAHLTHGEFSESLSYLPNEAYDTIRRMTRLFYAVRFGQRRLTGDEQRDLNAAVDALEPVLNLAAPPR